MKCADCGIEMEILSEHTAKGPKGDDQDVTVYQCPNCKQQDSE